VIELLLDDDMAAEKYGDIRAALEKSGKTIGPLDMLIAAMLFLLAVFW